MEHIHKIIKEGGNTQCALGEKKEICLNPMYDWVRERITNGDDLLSKHGIQQNDLNIGNVYYDIDNKIVSLIDFGESTIKKSESAPLYKIPWECSTINIAQAQLPKKSYVGGRRKTNRRKTKTKTNRRKSKTNSRRRKTNRRKK